MIGRDQVISSKGDNREVNQVTTSPEGEDLLNEGRSAITESKASTQDPEKGVEKPPTVDPSNTAKSLTVDSSKVKGKHDGVTEDNAGSEEFRATTSEDKPGVKDSVPVSPKGKEDDQNSLIVNLNGDPDGRVSVEMPELIAPTHDPERGVEQSLVIDQLDTTKSPTVDLSEVQSEYAGKAEDNAGFKEVGTKANEYKPDPDVEDSVPLDSKGQESDQTHFTVKLSMDPDVDVLVNMPEDMEPTHNPKTGAEQPPALDPLDTPAKTEGQEIFLTTAKSAGDKNAASEVETDKDEADIGDEAAFLEKEDKFATFNSQHLHDQVDLEFANEILVEGGDVGPARSAVHKCLDRFIAEKITVGREQNLTERFGPYLFRDEAFIEAWGHYTGLTADEIKKDLAEKIPELENAKADLSEWLKVIFSEAKTRFAGKTQVQLANPDLEPPIFGDDVSESSTPRARQIYEDFEGEVLQSMQLVLKEFNDVEELKAALGDVIKKVLLEYYDNDQKPKLEDIVNERVSNDEILLKAWNSYVEKQVQDQRKLRMAQFKSALGEVLSKRLNPAYLESIMDKELNKLRAELQTDWNDAPKRLADWLPKAIDEAEDKIKEHLRSQGPYQD